MIDKEKAILAQESAAHCCGSILLDVPEHLLTADQLRELIDKAENWDKYCQLCVKSVIRNDKT